MACPRCNREVQVPKGRPACWACLKRRQRMSESEEPVATRVSPLERLMQAAEVAGLVRAYQRPKEEVERAKDRLRKAAKAYARRTA